MVYIISVNSATCFTHKRHGALFYRWFRIGSNGQQRLKQIYPIFQRGQCGYSNQSCIGCGHPRSMGILLAGMFFVGIQLLQKYGYVSAFNWNKLGNDNSTASTLGRWC